MTQQSAGRDPVDDHEWTWLGDIPGVRHGAGDGWIHLHADGLRWVHPEKACESGRDPVVERITPEDRRTIIRLLRGYAFADEGMADEAHRMADKLDEVTTP